MAERSGPPGLEIRGLNVFYGASHALQGVDLTLKSGVLSVVGRNGMGKTTLCKAVMGLVPAASGTISFRGQPLTGRSPAEIARMGVGYVPQGRRLWRSLTVDEHLKMVAKPGGAVILDGEDISRLSPQARAKKGVGYVPQGRMIFPLLTVQENLETGFGCLPRGERRVPEAMFELFPVLKEMRNRRGGDLSGGQQQQLAIARALITRPKLLLLDEPTEGIQPNIIQQIGRVIAMLRDEGKMAIVLVEQYFDFAYGLADRFYAVTRGAVTMEGAKAEVDRDRLLSAVSV